MIVTIPRERREGDKGALQDLIEMIAQADTGGALRNLGSRGAIIVDLAKELTDEYGFFKYWNKED